MRNSNRQSNLIFLLILTVGVVLGLVLLICFIVLCKKCAQCRLQSRLRSDKSIKPRNEKNSRDLNQVRNIGESDPEDERIVQLIDNEAVNLEPICDALVDSSCKVMLAKLSEGELHVEELQNSVSGKKIPFATSESRENPRTMTPLLTISTSCNPILSCHTMDSDSTKLQSRVAFESESGLRRHSDYCKRNYTLDHNSSLQIPLVDRPFSISGCLHVAENYDVRKNENSRANCQSKVDPKMVELTCSPKRKMSAQCLPKQKKHSTSLETGKFAAQTLKIHDRKVKSFDYTSNSDFSHQSKAACDRKQLVNTICRDKIVSYYDTGSPELLMENQQMLVELTCDEDAVNDDDNSKDFLSKRRKSRCSYLSSPFPTDRSAAQSEKATRRNVNDKMQCYIEPTATELQMESVINASFHANNLSMSAALKRGSPQFNHTSFTDMKSVRVLPPNLLITDSCSRKTLQPEAATSTPTSISSRNYLCLPTTHQSIHLSLEETEGKVQYAPLRQWLSDDIRNASRPRRLPLKRRQLSQCSLSAKSAAFADDAYDDGKLIIDQRKTLRATNSHSPKSFRSISPSFEQKQANLLQPPNMSYETRRENFRNAQSRRNSRFKSRKEESFLDPMDSDTDVENVCDYSQDEQTATFFDRKTDKRDSIGDRYRSRLQQMHHDSGYKSLENHVPQLSISKRFATVTQNDFENGTRETKNYVGHQQRMLDANARIPSVLISEDDQELIRELAAAELNQAVIDAQMSAAAVAAATLAKERIRKMKSASIRRHQFGKNCNKLSQSIKSFAEHSMLTDEKELDTNYVGSGEFLSKSLDDTTRQNVFKRFYHNKKSGDLLASVAGNQSLVVNAVAIMAKVISAPPTPSLSPCPSPCPLSITTNHFDSHSPKFQLERDFTIDVKTNAIFNDFMKQDPRFESQSLEKPVLKHSHRRNDIVKKNSRFNLQNYAAFDHRWNSYASDKNDSVEEEEDWSDCCTSFDKIKYMDVFHGSQSNTLSASFCAPTSSNANSNFSRSMSTTVVFSNDNNKEVEPSERKSRSFCNYES